jgi:hypothetical protein
MLSLAGGTGRAGRRRQENCVEIAPGGAYSMPLQRLPSGQTRRGRQPGAVTLEYAPDRRRDHRWMAGSAGHPESPGVLGIPYEVLC